MSAHFNTLLPGELRGADLDRMNLILGSVRYAMDRALAHAEHPGEFPIPDDAESLEKVFVPSISKLKPGVRRRMADDARDRLKKGVSERVAFYGDIGRQTPSAAVDTLHELKQSFASPRFRATPAEIAKDPLERFKPQGRAARATPPTTLELFARQITCVEDTRELGKDEISLGGIRQEANINATAGTISGSRSILYPISLGKFKSGDPPRPINQVLASFDLAATPKLCSFELFLAETDILKGFKHELEEARDFVPNRAIELLGSVSLAGILLGLSGVIFPVTWPGYLMILVIIAVVLLANAIFAALRDDVFPPHQIGVPLATPDFTFPGGALETNVETVIFSKFGGSYKLDFNWRLV